MSSLKQHVGLNMVKLQVQVREVGENDVVLPLKKIIRPAQTEDLKKWRRIVLKLNGLLVQV